MSKWIEMKTEPGELKPCACGAVPELYEYYIHGVANRKNFVVSCPSCRRRTLNRNKPEKAIAEWNEIEWPM